MKIRYKTIKPTVLLRGNFSSQFYTKCAFSKLIL